MRRNKEKKERETKKCGKLKLFHLGIVLGAAIYFIWRHNCSLKDDLAIENESGLESFDDYY